MSANTSWSKVEVSLETAKFLRGTHLLYSRIADGEHIFTASPLGKEPNQGDGGYRSIDSALKAKGMR